jgi:hypothetical protein
MHIRRNGASYLGNHEPLISKRLFGAVQDALNGRFNVRTKKHEFLFRRLMTCKPCGYVLIGETRKGHIYYRCHTKDCPTHGIREEHVAEFVQRSLQALQFSRSENEYLRRRVEQLKCEWIEERDRQIAALNMRIQQIAERLNRLTDAYLDAAVERDLFEARKKDLLFERRSIEDQLRILKDDPDAVPQKFQKFLGLAGDAYSLYQMAIPEKKRRLLKIVTSDLTLCEKTLEFTYVPPFREVATRETDHDGGPSKGLARTCEALISSLLAKVESFAPLIAAYETGGLD